MTADAQAMTPWPENIEVVDCHHHLWDLQANYYPWLTDRVGVRVCGDYAAIRKNYLLNDFLRDTQDVNLVQSVHVEAVMDTADPARETRWLQALADAPDGPGLPNGIVAYCDLGRVDAADVLERHRAFANLRGIRQMLHESRIAPGDEKAPPTPLDNPVWWRNFALLEAHDLSFELQVYPEQMADAAKLVGRFPNTLFVLCHTGQPRDRDEAGLRAWRDGLALLARFENVTLKISGLGMFDRTWSVDTLRPIITDAIAIFSPARCMFASNFPVDGMMSSYGRLWRAYLEITSGFLLTERQALFAATARRIYRLGDARRKPSQTDQFFERHAR